MGVGGFAAMRALSTRNDDPKKRAVLDKIATALSWRRRGILVLEELEYARRRGAPILAEIAAMACPATPTHDQPLRARRRISRHAQCRARCRHHSGPVDYVNAHGTSTPIGDTLELTPSAISSARARSSQFHQIHDGHLLAAPAALKPASPSSPPRSDPAAHHQPRQPDPKPPAWISSPTMPAKPNSNTPCRILSASRTNGALLFGDGQSSCSQAKFAPDSQGRFYLDAELSTDNVLIPRITK